jgi:hypothetical protein
MYSSAAMQQNQPRQSSPYPLESTNTAGSPRGGSISSSAGIYAEPQPPSSQQRFLNRHYNKNKSQPGSKAQTPSSNQGSLQSSRGRSSASSRRAAAAAAAAQVGATSTSSSENVSDTAYQESDMTKDNRLHLENGKCFFVLLYFYITLFYLSYKCHQLTRQQSYILFERTNVICIAYQIIIILCIEFY